jgi:hypothetical protein
VGGVGGAAGGGGRGEAGWEEGKIGEGDRVTATCWGLLLQEVSGSFCMWGACAYRESCSKLLGAAFAASLALQEVDEQHCGLCAQLFGSVCYT